MTFDVVDNIVIIQPMAFEVETDSQRWKSDQFDKTSKYTTAINTNQRKHTRNAEKRQAYKQQKQRSSQHSFTFNTQVEMIPSRSCTTSHPSQHRCERTAQ